MPRTKGEKVTMSDQIRKFLDAHQPPANLSQLATAQWIMQELKKKNVHVTQHTTLYVLYRRANKAKERTAKARAVRQANIRRQRMSIPVVRMQPKRLPKVSSMITELQDVRAFAGRHGGVKRAMELLDLFDTMQ
jgi:hypothetical protein